MPVVLAIRETVTPPNRYFFPGFRSLDKRLTISEAVRSISLESIPLLGSYTDHNTWRDSAAALLGVAPDNQQL